MICAPGDDSNQPEHLPSLIRVFAVRLKKAWVLSYPLSTQRRLWSDWADDQADLSLRWMHRSFCWFCHDAAQISKRWCGREQEGLNISWMTYTKLTHIWLMDYSIPINWTSPFSNLGMSGAFLLILFLTEFPVSKQCRHWSDVAFCGVWSGSALFAYVLKMGR